MFMELKLLVLIFEAFTMVLDFPRLIEVALDVPNPRVVDESINGVVMEELKVLDPLKVFPVLSLGMLDVRYVSWIDPEGSVIPEAT